MFRLMIITGRCRKVSNSYAERERERERAALTTLSVFFSGEGEKALFLECLESVSL